MSLVDDFELIYRLSKGSFGKVPTGLDTERHAIQADLAGETHRARFSRREDVTTREQRKRPAYLRALHHDFRAVPTCIPVPYIINVQLYKTF